jgi:hypothetical protein
MKRRLGDRLRIGALVSICALLLTAACGAGKSTGASTPVGPGDDDGSPSVDIDAVALVLPAGVAPAVRLAAEDAAALLGQIDGLTAGLVEKIATDGRTFNIAVVGPGVAAAVFSAAELAEMPAESFRLRAAGATTLAVAGADARGQQYGLYDALERLGFRFFHPEQTYTPPAFDASGLANLDVYEKPDWGRRGFHVHTMHPIEASEFVLVPSPQHQVWAQHLIDWLARNKQNYWQFELLRTVDYQKTAPYFTTLVNYAHSRGVDAGVVVTWVFQQQKAWKLMPATDAENKPALEKSLAQIMQVAWDHINLEMGTTEFTSVNDKLQVAWMNDTVAYLAANYPNTTASVKVHCSTGQTAPDYGNINFNYLAQFADKRMGIYPHSVMYYGLQGPAPVYGNQNLDGLYRWTLSMIDGVRKVYYYPETAYWVTFDIDVPLFLPLYIYSRAADIALLRDKGLDGQVDFTSGHEWGYWLSDWAVARLVWNSEQQWTDVLDSFAAIFGDQGPTLSAIVRDLALTEQKWLINEQLASYLAGEDTWDELGWWLGEATYPKPVFFAELYGWNEAQVQAFQNSVIANLDGLEADFASLLTRIQNAGAGIPAAAQPWYQELVDSFHVNQLRAAHLHALWAGAAVRRLNELGVAPDGEAEAQEWFAQAKALTTQYQATVQAREAHYRYPLFYSTGWQRSVTAYDYRYLYQVSNAYWFKRAEAQAIDKNFNPFLMNLLDPIWFFF